jgi:hypothetical protein
LPGFIIKDEANYIAKSTSRATLSRELSMYGIVDFSGSIDGQTQFAGHAIGSNWSLWPLSQNVLRADLTGLLEVAGIFVEIPIAGTS